MNKRFLKNRLVRGVVKFKLAVQRFLAFGLDASFVTTLAFVLLDGARLMSPAYTYHRLWETSNFFALDLLLVVLFKLPLIEPMVVSAFYVVLSTRLIGGTPGMWAFDLKMQCDNGESPSVVQVTVRHFVSYVSVVLLGLGYFWALLDPRGRTWHDLASGITVVDPGDEALSLGNDN